jgi:GntR family transcriptional repressor for pyruvate dehydrogenase complex
VSFTPIEKIGAADQVADSIRDAIITGELSAGEGLPSERSLASSFAVNRGTVREAIRRLEAIGLVRTRHGGRTRVQDILASAGLHLLPFLIAPRGKPDPALIRDLLQVRVMILSWTARWAARASNPDTAPLARIVADLEAGIGDRQERDFDFFEALIAISDNRILGMLATLIRDAYFQHRDLFAPLYGDHFSAEPHRRTLRAIQQRMPDAAAAVMREYAETALLSEVLS